MSALVPHKSEFVDVLVLRDMPTAGGRNLVGYPLRRTGMGNGLVNVFMNSMAKGKTIPRGTRVRAAAFGGGVRMSLAEIYVPDKAMAA